MTAVTDSAGVPELFVVDMAHVQRRLDQLLADDRGRASWWVDLTRNLDALAVGLRDDSDSVGRRLFYQLKADAPHLLGRHRRLAGEREAIVDEVTAARVLASTHAGDPQAVGTVTGTVHALLMRVRRYQEKTTEMLFDAYGRDIGGE
ncbi:MAG: hypothetical protein ACOYEV_08155 [Candidatus Nanopelagicales bacterium]